MCAKYESQRVANKSTYWVKFELTWRDYFVYYAHKYGEKLFFPYGVKGSSRKWRVDGSALKAWKEGRTGAPLVDANMRELRATGFMSNRGRQNVASYFVHDLGLDWRLGAEHFEELLVDYTPEQLGQLARRGRPLRRPRQPLQHPQAVEGLRRRRDVRQALVPRTREGAGAVLPHALAPLRGRQGAPRLRRLPAAAEDARLQGSAAEEGQGWRPRQDQSEAAPSPRVQASYLPGV